MSDCGDGLACVEGTCRGNDEAPPPSPLASALDASFNAEAATRPSDVKDAATPDAPLDAGGSVDAAMDGASDG